LTQDADRNFILADNRKLDAAIEYFRVNGLTTELPRELDYDLLTYLEVASFQGKRIARLDFQSANRNRMPVYVLSQKDFRLARQVAEVMGSRCRVEIVEGPKDYLYVYICFDNQVRRDEFMPKRVGA